jgi:hypothetical protein
MSSYNDKYLDGNAAAGDLSTCSLWMLPRQKDSVRTAVL